MIIAVDFDGTCVKSRFPYVGESIGAEIVLRELVRNGHHIILNTMRSHPIPGSQSQDLLGLGLIPTGRDVLQDAIDWFTSNDIGLYGVNVNPTQRSWTQSPKVYAELYIDDMSLGAPLYKDSEGSVFVDWRQVVKFLDALGCINSVQTDRLLQEIDKFYVR